MRQKFFILLLGIGFLLPFFPDETAVYGQASINVPPQEGVYRDLGKLTSFGIIDTIIVGQSPYSRREIGRLIDQAEANLHRLDQKTPLKNEAEKIIQRIKNDYAEAVSEHPLSFHLLDEARFDSTVDWSPTRTLNDTTAGGIRTRVNPLLQYREGRHLVDGRNFFLETSHWVQGGNPFVVFVRPRLQFSSARAGDPDIHALFLQNLYGKFFFRNFEVEVGRDDLIWGQGRNGGQILSSNKRPIDMVKISNDSPFHLPSVFKYLGANKISFFFADLGGDQLFPHPYLMGYKWSVQPVGFFEFGFGLVVESGGQGSPDTSFGNRVADLFGFTSSTGGPSNKLGGFDFRFRVPPAKGMEIYGEANFDDDFPLLKTSQYHNLFIDNAGYIAGVYFPRLSDTGHVDLSLEYHMTGKTFYRHGQFTTGLTLNQYVIGDALGPDSQGVYAVSTWDLDDADTLTFETAFESRSDDVWTTDAKNNYFRLQDRPEERRYRISTAWRHRFLNIPLLLTPHLAYERVQNFGFTSAGRNNFLLQLTANFKF